jgi:hypothetical protein
MLIAEVQTAVADATMSCGLANRSTFILPVRRVVAVNTSATVQSFFAPALRNAHESRDLPRGVTEKPAEFFSHKKKKKSWLRKNVDANQPPVHCRRESALIQLNRVITAIATASSLKGASHVARPTPRRPADIDVRRRGVRGP